MLEAIDLEQRVDDRFRRRLRRRTGRDPCDRLPDCDPIGQLSPEAGLEGAFGGQVTLHGDVGGRPARLVAHRRDGGLLLEVRAVLAPVDEEASPGSAGQQGGPHAVVEGRVVVAALEDPRVLPEELRAGVARDPLEGGVRVHDPAVRIGDDDRLRCLVDRRGQARPIRLGFVDGRDILGDDHRPAHSAVFVAQRRDEELEVARPTIPMRVADRDGDERLAGHHLGKPARDPGRIVGAEDRGRVAHDLVLAPAEHELGSRAPGGDPAIAIHGHDGQGAGSEDRGRGLDGRAPLSLRAGEEMIPSRQDAPQRDRRDHDEPDTLHGAHDLAGAAGQDGADEGRRRPGSR